jgi:cell division protein FtsQ
VAPNRRTLPPARGVVVALPRLQRLDGTRALPSGKTLAVVFASTAAAAGLYALARVTPTFSVHRIDITGTDRTGRVEAERALADLRGKSLLAVGAGDVGRRLARLPDVAAARYDREFPHTLRVVLVPERPVAVLRRGRDTWLVSGDARVLRRIPRGTFGALPRVWAPRSLEVALGSGVSGRPGAIAEALARLRTTPLPSGVRGATYTDENGLTFLLRNGLAVRLGSTHELDLKLAVARRIVPLVPPETTLVDVTVPARPVSENSQPGG